MQFSEMKNYYINNVYIPYINGDKGTSRTALAQIYKDGVKNPRGTLYQIQSCSKDVNKVFTKNCDILESNAQKDKMMDLFQKHIEYSKELANPKHPLIQSAFEQLQNSMKEMYPSKKTRKFTHFILQKQCLPFLNKMKFLAKFPLF